ncbi:collagen alpha-1(I) chain-like [Agelaius tricolor]|uniref:collagen alpha-1(I) chain-like n=1 Tax=Agelaius tricolor TaxID=9191 RepID=UPI0039F1E34A
MPPRTRGRAPGFRDRTSTRKTGGKKGKKQTHSPKAGQEAGEPAPPTASPREGRRRPHPRRPSEAAQAPGLGPASARRAGRRAPDARGAQGGPPASRFHGTTRTTHTARGRGRAAVGPRAAPALPSAPTPRAWRGAPPRRRAAGVVSLPPTTTRGTGLSPGLETGTRRRPAQPAGTPPAGPLPRRAGGRASDRRTRSAAGPGGGRHREPSRRRLRPRPAGRQTRPPPGRQRPAPPPPPRTAGAPRLGHAPGGKAPRRLSRGATPALLVRTRRPGGEERPRGRPRHAFLRGPHAAARARATEARRRAEPGTGPPPADGGRRPADRPRREGHPSSGAAAARHGVARARGPPPPEGPPSARPPPPTGGRGGRARGRPADDGAAAPRLRGRKGRRGEERRRTRRTRRRRARQRPRRRAQERERGRAPAAVAPRPRKGQRARALCRASPVTTRRAGRPPRPTARRGLSAEAGPRRGGGRAPLPGAARLTPPAARGGDDDDDGRDGGARPVATGQPPQGIGGSSCSPPLRGAPHGHRPRHTPAAAAAAAAAATAGRAEPPESLNRRPAPPAPLSAQPAAFDDAEGKKTWGGPPRRRALGTWPWGEGNDLHGPAGVPPPLPPSGERPPAGARPTSAATTATSFSGPGVSLSSPALRAREDRRGSGRPAGAGDTRARPPSTTSGARARHPARPGTPGGLGPRTSSAAREKGGRSARERDTLPRPAKAPAAPRCGKGRRSRLLRGPEGAPATRLPRPFGQAAREGDGRASGRGRAEHPSLPAPGRPISRATPRREPSSGELGPRRQGGPHARRRPAFGGAGRSGERLGGPRPRAPPLSGGDGPAADRRKAGAAGRCTGQGGGGGRKPPRRRPARHASRPGRDARCSAGRAPPARTVTGARGALGRAQRLFPSPPPLLPIPPRARRCRAPLVSLSLGAAARGQREGRVAPGAGRGRRPGAERANGSGPASRRRAPPDQPGSRHTHGGAAAAARRRPDARRGPPRRRTRPAPKPRPPGPPRAFSRRSDPRERHRGRRHGGEAGGEAGGDGAPAARPRRGRPPRGQREGRHLACDGKRIGKETALPEAPDPPRRGFPATEKPRKESRPAGGPLRRHPKSHIDQPRLRADGDKGPTATLPGTTTATAAQPACPSDRSLARRSRGARGVPPPARPQPATAGLERPGENPAERARKSATDLARPRATGGFRARPRGGRLALPEKKAGGRHDKRKRHTEARSQRPVLATGATGPGARSGGAE